MQGDQPAGGSGGQEKGAGKYTATSLKPSATWDVSGHTGNFTWNYPIEAPDVPGGLKPELALSYSSGSLDGLTSATNTQASWIGDGWSLWPGYIERSYASCVSDLDNGSNDKPGDFCWKSDNATLSLGGSGSKLIKDDETGEWRPKSDDGSRVERLTGANNSDNNGEYWKVTEVDGTQYFYGSRPDSKSTWTAPVFGNDAGEPCHGPSFAESSCKQGYRWNLDKVVDPNGNVIHYSYETATNHYGLNNNSESVEYVRDGWLKKIEYGIHEKHVQQPSARILFDVADRCVPGSTCDREHEENWPDVPWRLECTGNCDDTQNAPTFWSTKRLSKITTQVRGDSGFTAVDSWSLRHEFPDPGDGEQPALWLDGITHTGHVGGSAALPEVEFEGVPKPNRVYAEDGHAALIRYRISAIVSEAGGVLSVKYAEPDCETGVNMPEKPETNTLRCFPVTWSAPYVSERTDYFHKYVVESITEHDRIGSTTGSITKYEYLGGAAWAHSSSEVTSEEDRNWNEFRGFGRVRIRTGSGNDGPVTLTEKRFFQGMDGDALPNNGERSVRVTDSEGNSYTDHEWLRGFAFETITYNGEGGPVVNKTVTEPTWQGPTAKNGDLESYMVNSGTETTYTPLSSGGRRVTRTETSYNKQGLVTRVNDLGNVDKPEDDLCKRTSYARNTDSWLLNLPKRKWTNSVACGKTPSMPQDAVSDTRTSYDGGNFGDAPTSGNVTEVEELERYNNGSPEYTTVATKTFDAHGRVLTTTDALGRETTTSYTPKLGGPVTETSVTNPAGHTATTTLHPLLGAPVKEVGPDGRITEITYDALGRRTNVWLPNRDRGESESPSQKYSYRIAKEEPVVVTTSTLNSDGDYVSYNKLLDGLLRPRQIQRPASGGGRLITEKHYDSHGRVYRATRPYFNDNPVDKKLWRASSAGEVPAMSRIEYDGAGRQVAEIFMAGGVEKWRTEYGYGGDRTHVTPPDGGVPTTTINDARGRKVELRQYKNSTTTGEYDSTSYTYTDAGQLETVTDPGGNTWRYTFDLRGRKVKAEDPDRGTTSYSYDAAGQMVSQTDARGKTLAYSYDELGRKTATHTGSLNGQRIAEWDYDSALYGSGKLASSTRWIDGNAYKRRIVAYNAQEKPTRINVTVPDSEGKLSGTYTTKYEFEEDGSLANKIFPSIGGLDKESIGHSYDSLGNPATTWGSPNKEIKYVSDTRYTSYGELARVQMGEIGNRVWQSYYYDEHTRRTERTIVDAEVSEPMQADLAYSYDPAGNITSIADQPRSGAPDVQCFRYDYLRRLTEAWTTGSQCSQDPATEDLGGAAPYWRSYTYDEVGNRLTETRHSAGGDSVREYSYEEQGHALNSVSTGGAKSGEFGYDAAGNMTSRKVSGSDQSLEWSARGNLTRVSTPDGESTEFVYDADGKRLLRRSPSGTTLYLDGQQLRWDAESGELSGTRYYTHGGRTVAVRESGAGLTWLASDHQGTSKLAVDAGSLETTRRRFLPFGGSRGDPADFPGEKGFVGGTIDSSVGLTTLGARQYDPSIGRFLSVDPVMDLTDPQQMHGYTYGNNSPLTYSDPTGLQPVIGTDEEGQLILAPFPGNSTSNNGKTHRPSSGSQTSSGAGSSRPRVDTWGANRPDPSPSPSETHQGPVPYNAKLPSGPKPSISIEELKAQTHRALEYGGLIPVIGNIADGANCIWYGAEGKTTDALLSCGAMIPGIGLGIGVGVIAAKTGMRASDDIAKGLKNTTKKSPKKNKKKNENGRGYLNNNAAVGDLKNLKQGNDLKREQEIYGNYSDEELLRAVRKPRGGMGEQPGVTTDGKTLLNGNHRAKELIRRAEDSNSSISYDTPIPLINFKGD
ncbi:RHS repeat-associated core domain-containing protein [Actinopolyspora lacussalsi]